MCKFMIYYLRKKYNKLSIYLLYFYLAIDGNYSIIFRVIRILIICLYNICSLIITNTYALHKNILKLITVFELISLLLAMKFRVYHSITYCAITALTSALISASYHRIPRNMSGFTVCHLLKLKERM